MKPLSIVCGWQKRLLNVRYQIFAGRFQLVWTALLAFLTLNGLVRLGLLVFNGDWALLLPDTLLPIFGIGLAFDLAAAAWWLPAFALVATLWPGSPTHRQSFRIVAILLLSLIYFIWIFVGTAEFVFWNEFASRFNFIAVDYLVYTHEVIGNIRESYDLRPLFFAIGVATLILLAASRRGIDKAAGSENMCWRERLWRLGIFLLLPLLTWPVMDARFKEFTDNVAASQLAGNGQYEFWHAFRTNEIDYPQFYLTEPTALAYKVLRGEFEHFGPQHFTPKSRMPMERDIVGHGHEQRLNVVLISVESLSAEFMAAFGNREDITPNLDRLAKDGLFFKHIYATGTRTVRGLEALTLSIPPTPGNSIIKRPNNDHLHTLGEVFAGYGYEPLFLYGGYGYFDNMNAFFSGNGYTVIDRSAIAKEQIHYENIWGVADEDLYSLTLDELDKRYHSGKRFFAHVMTTSNHRPFTYPEGRIDIRSGSGRSGAVKYSDWAIGDFIARARAKPWFQDTVFVIVADHTATGRGKTALPVEQFHIPLLIYSPGHIKPAQIDTLASQIDVGPTLLGLLNFSYRSDFFGQDIIHEGPQHKRAFMANYQTVGYLEDGILVELRPQQRWRLIDPATDKELPVSAKGQELLEEAVSYYQSASEAFRNGAMRIE